MAISSFEYEHEFLSNFYDSPVMLDGMEYPTVEHAFQAAKTLDFTRRKAIQLCDTPGKAKRLGRQVNLRVDWDDIKDDIMFYLVFQKFQIPKLRTKLIDTNEEVLIEGNTWGDTYWGVCKGAGKNKLGLILMRIRSCLT